MVHECTLCGDITLHSHFCDSCEANLAVEAANEAAAEGQAHRRSEAAFAATHHR